MHYSSSNRAQATPCHKAGEGEGGKPFEVSPTPCLSSPRLRRTRLLLREGMRRIRRKASPTAKAVLLILNFILNFNIKRQCS
jgi:hypothetical protein